MKIHIKGDSKEIADLVREIQGQQKGPTIHVGGCNTTTSEERLKLSSCLKSILTAPNQGAEKDQKQQPDSTEHTQTGPEEPYPPLFDPQSDK